MNSNVFRRARAVGLGVALVTCSGAFAQVYIERVAVIGEQTDHGTFTSAFEDVSLNASGRLAFTVSLGEITPDYPSVWTGVPGSLSPRLLVGEVVMSSRGPVTIGPMPMLPLRINAAGDVAMVTNGMVIRTSGTTKEVLLRDGDATPSGGIFAINAMTNPDIESSFRFNNQGRVVSRFRGGLNDPYLTSTLLDSPTVRSTPFVAGTPIGPAGSGLVHVGSNPPIFLNNAGLVARTADISGPGVTSLNDEVLLAYDGTEQRIVAREGSPVGGASGGRTLRRVSGYMSLSDSGRLGMSGTLNPLGAGDIGGRCLLFGDVNGLNVSVREGDVVPGFSPGVNYRAILDPTINDSGQAAFVSEVSDPNAPWGAWRLESASSTPVLFAKYGDAAPGTDRTFWDAYPRVVMNNVGQILFESRLSGGGWGLFATTLDGTLVKVAATGDLFDIGFDRMARATRVDAMDEATTGLLSRGAFNDLGMVAFRVTFEDGTSGVYRAQVPAPTGAAVLGVAGLLAVRRRRVQD